MPGEKTILEGVKSFFLPEFNKVEGELKVINSRLDSLNGKIDTAGNELKSDIDSLSGKIDTIGNELKAEIGSTRTDISRVEGVLGVETGEPSKCVDVVKDIEKLRLQVAELIEKSR